MKRRDMASVSSFRCFSRLSGLQRTSGNVAGAASSRRSQHDRPSCRRETGQEEFAHIPEDASGEYMLGHPGEVVEITLQFGALSGYISRQGDGESDSGTPLTFFFDQTSFHGQELRFTTQQIHGVWYSFQGTIARGSGKTREEDGYYVLMGDLDGTRRRAQNRVTA